jgi:hypothetical protein
MAKAKEKIARVLAQLGFGSAYAYACMTAASHALRLVRLVKTIGSTTSETRLFPAFTTRCEPDTAEFGAC